MHGQKNIKLRLIACNTRLYAAECVKLHIILHRLYFSGISV